MEILKELLAALGGGIIVLTGFLYFCKGIVNKYIDSLIETSAEKNIKKIENKFARSISAFELLLKKEFDFYESIDTLLAELIVHIQDCHSGITEPDLYEDRVSQCNMTRDTFARLLKIIPELKNYNLRYQPYIPKEIFSATTALISTLQNSSDVLLTELKKVFDNKIEDVNVEAITEIKDCVLMDIAFLELKIKSRLNSLSNDN